MSQEFIYSILPRPIGQVELKERMVEQVVRRSSFKAIDEKESALSPPVAVAGKELKVRKGERRKGERRSAARAEKDSKTVPEQAVKSLPEDDDKSEGLDLFV